ALTAAALVDEPYAEALGQERGLAHSLRQCLEVEQEVFEYLEVGEERDRRPGLPRRRSLLQRLLRHAALVGLRPDVAVALDLELEPLGERVHDRDADPVETARDLVAAPVAELAAGVQDGQHDLGGGALLLLVHVDRDAAPVVGNGDAAVGVQDDLDRVAKAGDCLVDGVVDDLVHEVVKTARTGRADIHPGSLPNGLEALEDRDVGCLGAGGRARTLRGVTLRRPPPRGRARGPFGATLGRPVFRQGTSWSVVNWDCRCWRRACAPGTAKTDARAGGST